ncbi:hypothetical protein J3R30DRAFT_3447116 [Lentinula aciculospora]|uniref:E3 ubiquitin protein ligase n=1 Tax=Lentinula aciculospora TaxID=153920 RepID=A0A9W9AHZ7_9AGAR|nr:hypothetical protein J3R30DRAFT_3447116 [Lentinula aciculospora]
MAETRKRFHSAESDSDTVILKKHIISDENGSPKVNGVGKGHIDDVEPTADDKLELFRKEAIFRRMLHYSRLNEASQKRISELEERKNTCEAGLAAISACWIQLVDAIRVLVDSPVKQELGQPIELSPSTQDLQELFTLSRYVSDDSMPELKSALEKSRHATQELVMRFVQKGSPLLSQDTPLKEYQKTQTECAALKAQVQVLQVRLSDSEELGRKLRQELSEEQNRLQRLKSKTVQANLPKAGMSSAESLETTEDAILKPSSPAPNGFTPKMQEEWEERAAYQTRLLREQDKIIDELRKTKSALELEINKKALTKSEVLASPFYQRVLQRSASALNAASAKEDELRLVKSEYAQYREEREKYEKELRDESAVAINETLALIARRDADNARLREDRDQRVAELHERRNKESIKTASCEEYKSLAISRADRISALESQLHRTKLKLASNAGREDIVKFLLEMPGKDVEFAQYLQTRLSETETRLVALEEVLAKLNQEHPDIAHHVRSEAGARQKLSEVTAQLTQYRTLYGEFSLTQSDRLESELQRKEDELRQLRLLNVQHTQAESALYTEIEKLGSAWEALDSQVKNKIFDLSAMEDRLTKVTVERAKSDNKFYAASRERDAVEAERKNLIRNMEKQGRALDLQKETEQRLNGLLAATQDELSKYRAYCQETHDHPAKQLSLKSSELHERANEGIKMANLYREQIDKFQREHLSRQEALRKEMDAMSAAKMALEKERLALESKAKFDSTRHQHKTEDPDAELMALLKCSTCNLKFRDTILTKCCHTFCRPCVDARISSRQRKCPACGLGFAQSDVLKIYMQ